MDCIAAHTTDTKVRHVYLVFEPRHGCCDAGSPSIDDAKRFALLIGSALLIGGSHQPRKQRCSAPSEPDWQGRTTAGSVGSQLDVPSRAIQVVVKPLSGASLDIGDDIASIAAEPAGVFGNRLVV